MKRSLAFFFAALMLCSILTSCNRSVQQESFSFSRCISRYIDEDGWVYTAIFFYYNDGTFDDSVPPLEFSVINLRYKDISYINTAQTYHELNVGDYKRSIRILGEGVDPDTDADMQAIADYLGYGTINSKFLPASEIVKKNRDDVYLSVLPKEIVFSLIDDAYNGQARTVGKYIQYPTYALLSEKKFEEGYKFQVGFALGMGNIDVICIDIIFQNDDEGQLYTKVHRGFASDTEKSIWNRISEIEDGIVKNNDFCYGKDTDLCSKYETIDFSRLYLLLADIDKGEFNKYLIAK